MNAEMNVDKIIASLTLMEKALQMSIAPSFSFSADEMENTPFGGITTGGAANSTKTEWRTTTYGYQSGARSSNAKIPVMYGFDSIHGVSVCQNAVMFPQSIGIGAANDPELTYKMGLAVADEMKLCGAHWDFFPCVAQATDPRWGRTYESYSTDLELIKTLGISYMKGVIDGGILPCPKHFLGDGNVLFGTGEGNLVLGTNKGEKLIDRGNAVLTEAEIKKHLDIYKAMIEGGAMSIMLSHSSLNGVKMHENKKYIDILKNDLGFTGIVTADWDSVDYTSGATRKEKVINCVNAGCDMLMQVLSFRDSAQYIVEGVNEGLISESRVDDAVERIIRVKMSLGLFDNTLSKPKQTQVGSEEYRDIARQLVGKSQVLVKNEGEILPLKSGTKLYITGPAADNVKAQNGGWTLCWLGSDDVPGTVTIKKALENIAPTAGIELVDTAEAADVVLLVIGETAYAEWFGDSRDISITGACALEGNADAITEAKESSKPTVALIIAGRQVKISEYAKDWDAIVMGYLPGSEGDGVANVLTGKTAFTGKLPMPWYSDVSQIGTGESWLPVGFGLTTH
jgi:beta-glucosidase